MWSDRLVVTLKYIWLLSHVFLLCPRSIKDKLRNKKPSKWETLYLYLYNMISVGFVIYLVYTTTLYKIDSKFNIVIQLADLIFTISNNLSVAVTMLFCLFHQNTLTEVICKLDKINNKLRRLFIWKSYKAPQIFIASGILIVIIQWLWLLLNYLRNCKITLSECVLRWANIYTSTKISQVMLLFFCSLVVILKHKLYVINENIKQLFKDKNSDQSDVFYRETLDEIEKTYHDIIVVYTEVQSIFSIPLLMKTASLFITIFSSLYFSIFGYIYSDQLIIPRSFHDLALPLILIVISGSELLVTVTVCELTTIEYKRTSKLLYRIPIARNSASIMKRVS